MVRDSFGQTPSEAMEVPATSVDLAIAVLTRRFGLQQVRESLQRAVERREVVRRGWREVVSHGR